MNRLTDSGDYCGIACYGEDHPVRKECSLYNVCFERKLYERLQYYEDLEADGRLLELPKGYTPRIARAFTRVFCPREFGLIDEQCDEWKPESVLICYKCWEYALKGGGRNETFSR